MNLITGINKALSQAPISTSIPKLAQNASSPNPSKFATPPDTIALSKKIDEILNEKLLNDFGITSDIKDKNLLAKILQAVQEFSKLNNSRKLFNGLNITQKEMNGFFELDFGDAKNTIFFNKDFNFQTLSDEMEKLYQEGNLTTNNPLYRFYEAFGDYLNFEYNPYAWQVVQGRYYSDNSAKVASMLHNEGTNVGLFNKHYIASRMSGVELPKDMTIFFEENLGNQDLIYPPSYKHFIQGSVFNFKSIEEARQYLTQYGIDADFPTLEAANTCIGAIEDLIEATGNKNIFNGLRITQEIEDVVSTKAGLRWDYEQPNNPYATYLFFNKAYNWKKLDKLAQIDYDGCHHPTPKKKDIFMHELAHFIDFMSNPVKYGKRETDFTSGRLYFTEYGHESTGRVSTYASNSPAEFCAEYICGRMAGLKYPEKTVKTFEEYWLGPKLNFPIK